MSRARMTRTPDIIVTGRTTGSRLGGRAGVAPRGLGARGGRASLGAPVEPAGRAAGRPALPVRPGGTGCRGGMPAPLPAVVRPARQHTSSPTCHIDHSTVRAPSGSDAPAARCTERASTSQAGERGGPAVNGGLVELLLDPQELVVLRHALGPRGRAGLDLPRPDGDGEVGDRGVLGLAGAVAHHGPVPAAVG